MTAYAFRPMSAADLPTIQRWLGTPHVSQWWHDPSEQFELVSGDLGHPDMAQFIVTADTRDFAYLQCYNPSAWNTGFGAHPRAHGALISLLAKPICSSAVMVQRLFGSLPTNCSPPERRASSSTPIPAMRGRSGPTRRRDFGRIVDTPDGPALLMVRDP
jgi:aminoglycoside 6'-N-acetyltransferase